MPASNGWKEPWKVWLINEKLKVKNEKCLNDYTDNGMGHGAKPAG